MQALHQILLLLTLLHVCRPGVGEGVERVFPCGLWTPFGKVVIYGDGIHVEVARDARAAVAASLGIDP